MKARIDCTWKEDMMFESNVGGHKIIFDADESVGGKNQGARPKQVTLATLAGCTGMDVISILRKMKVEPSYFNMVVEGEPREEHPKIYEKIHITFEFKGYELPMDKLEKAITLSQEKYCSVTAMLNKSSEITWEIRIL
jgi:putative redox protein